MTKENNLKNINIIKIEIDIDYLEDTEDYTELKYLNLYGYSNGINTYKKNKNKVNFSNKNILIFPDNIKLISISFVNGFTEDIFKNINKDEFFKYFEIQGNEMFVNNFVKRLQFV